MADVTYTKSLASDFGGSINASTLDSEIRAKAEITTMLRRIDLSGDNVLIVFAATLSSAEEDALSVVIAAHNSAPTSNLQAVEFITPQIVGIKPTPIGNRAWIFSHDFCDKTTWYPDSEKVTNETVGTGNGITAIFNLAHSGIIDTSHGKISDEDLLVAPDAGNYRPVITIDDVVKSERIPFAESGGDYILDYATGQITFQIGSIPEAGKVIKATYYYATTSTIFIRPEAGQKMTITQLEMMCSEDFSLTDSVECGVYGYNPGNPAGPKILYGGHGVFKTWWDFVAWSRGAFPPVPVLGSGNRMPTKDIIQLRIDYISPVILDSAWGGELRCWTTNGLELDGEVACFTAYGITEAS